MDARMTDKNRYLGTISGQVAMDPTLGVTAKAVYMVLAVHADNTGYCFPSVETICKAVGRARSGVQAALAELEERGIIYRSERWTDEGRQTSNGYVLTDIRTIRGGRK